MPHEHEEISEILRFKPWPPWDPVPWWILRYLDERAVRNLAVIQLEAQHAALELQMKTIDKTLGALKGGGK
jgi:hypothetical protein